jgi:hypothetical protein
LWLLELLRCAGSGVFLLLLLLALLLLFGCLTVKQLLHDGLLKLQTSLEVWNTILLCRERK